MFGLFDPFGQHIRCVALHDRNAGLTDDRAFVHAFGDDVDGATGLGITRRDGAGMGVQTGIERQQGRVDIDHATLPFSDQPRGEDTHISGKGDDLNIAFLQFGMNGFFVGLAVLAKGAMGYGYGLYAQITRFLQTGSVLDIRKHQNHFVGAVRSLCGLGQRDHIGAGTGDQNGDAGLGRGGHQRLG